jgi:hypothetical protein
LSVLLSVGLSKINCICNTLINAGPFKYVEKFGQPHRLAVRI